MTDLLSRSFRCLLFVLFGTGFVPAAKADRPPNVVLIISDDQAYTDYSFMGHPQIKTPRIDRLASEGLTFKRGYVASSLCSPSLATILTGLYPHQHKVTSNDPPPPVGKKGVLANLDVAYNKQREEMVANFDRNPTLPRLLGSKGYASFQSGKWWGGNYKHGGFTQGMTHGNRLNGGRHGDDGLKIGRETMKPVTDFIDQSQKSGTPFFLWYAPMMPHTPHTPPERLLKKYKDKAPTIHVAKYWAMCEWFDESCGQLLDHLDRTGLAKDTIVVYIADNGWIQDPSKQAFAPRSKQSPYDGGLRTPIIIRWPGKIAPRISDQLASAVDLAPTILALTGARAPADLPGINLTDEKAVAARPAIFGGIFTHNAVDIHKPSTSLRYRWVISGKSKLIVPAPQNSPGAQVELYDLLADPDERKNLAGADEAETDRLRTMLHAWWPGREN